MDLYNEFPDRTRDQANTISKALSSPCTIIYLYFAHMWFIDGQNACMHNGYIISVKTSGKYKNKITGRMMKQKEVTLI